MADNNTPAPSRKQLNKERKIMILRELLHILPAKRKSNLLEQLIDALDNRQKVVVLRGIFQQCGKPSEVDFKEASKRLVPEPFASTKQLKIYAMSLLPDEDEDISELKKPQTAAVVLSSMAVPAAANARNTRPSAQVQASQVDQAVQTSCHDQPATRKRARVEPSVHEHILPDEEDGKGANTAIQKQLLDLNLIQLSQKMIQDMRDAGMEQEANAALLELQLYLWKYFH